MSAFSAQDVLVTVAAAGAAAVYLRQLGVPGGRSAAPAACASCPSGPSGAEPPVGTGDPAVQPLVLVRLKR